LPSAESAREDDRGWSCPRIELEGCDGELYKLARRVVDWRRRQPLLAG
jgi:hypothetical protein